MKVMSSKQHGCLKSITEHPRLLCWIKNEVHYRPHKRSQLEPIKI